MGLHQSSKKPDWEKIPEQKHNFWQKNAKKTNGMITPANLITLFGFILVIIGSIFLPSNILLGTILIAIGRACDIVDGIAADKTQTKSPLGEMLDAGLDKLSIGICVLAIFIAKIIPGEILLILIIQNGLNSFLSSAAKIKRITIHPTRLGKATTALQWISLILILILSAFDNQNSLIIAQAMLIISIAMGFISSMQYAKIFKSNKD